MEADPSMVDQFHKVNDGKDSYVAPEFINSDPYCSMTHSISLDPSLTFLTKKNDREVQWDAKTNDAAGEHIITLNVVGQDGVLNSTTYKLTVTPDCTAQTITAPSKTDQVYKVGSPEASYEVADFIDGESPHCPLTYTLKYDAAKIWILPLASGKGVKW